MNESQSTDRRRARSERTRSKLLDAAIECYTRNGIAATGMDEVAQQAGVGRATLYRHFNNQESLLLDVMAHNLRRIRDAVLESIRNCERTEDLYVEAAISILRETRERGLTTLLFGEDATSRTVNRITFSDPVIKRMGEEMLTPFLNQARREGVLRDWVTKPLLLEWTSRVMLSFIATPSERLDSPVKLRRFFHQAIIPSIIDRS